MSGETSTPTPAAKGPAMSDVRKAAIVMMSLGEDASTRVFKYLQEEGIERLAREVASLGAVPPETGEHVLGEFHQLAVAAEYITSGGVEHARRLLTKSLGPDLSRRILDRVLKSFNTS